MLWVPLNMGMSAAHCQGNVREFQSVWRVVTLHTHPHIWVVHYSQCYAGCVAAGVGELPQHQSGECTGWCNQSDGVRLAGFTTTTHTYPHIWVVHYSRCYAGCVAAGVGELPQHQSSECTGWCNQSNGVRLAGFAGGDTADNSSQHSAVDADPSLVHAARWSRRERRLHFHDQPRGMQHGGDAARQLAARYAFSVFWVHILETFLRHFPKIFLCQMTRTLSLRFLRSSSFLISVD